MTWKTFSTLRTFPKIRTKNFALSTIRTWQWNRATSPLDQHCLRWMLETKCHQICHQHHSSKLIVIKWNYLRGTSYVVILYLQVSSCLLQQKTCLNFFSQYLQLFTDFIFVIFYESYDIYHMSHVIWVI